MKHSTQLFNHLKSIYHNIIAKPKPLRPRIVDMFPVKVRITQDMLDNNDRLNITDCVGAKVLKSILGNDSKLDGKITPYWINNSCDIYFEYPNHNKSNEKGINIGSFDVNDREVYILDLHEPCDVIFKVI